MEGNQWDRPAIDSVARSPEERHREDVINRELWMTKFSQSPSPLISLRKRIERACEFQQYCAGGRARGLRCLSTSSRLVHKCGGQLDARRRRVVNTSMNSRVDGQLFGVSSRENPRDLLLLSVPPSQSSGNHPPLADRSAEAREPTLGARRAVPNTSAHLLCLVLWTGTEGTWRHTTGLFAWSSAGASP